MENDTFYASDDKSSIELIESDFALSRQRSLDRRMERELGTWISQAVIRSAVIIAAIVVFLLVALSRVDLR